MLTRKFERKNRVQLLKSQDSWAVKFDDKFVDLTSTQFRWSEEDRFYEECWSKDEKRAREVFLRFFPEVIEERILK